MTKYREIQRLLGNGLKTDEIVRAYGLFQGCYESTS